jgi:putative ABC transport system ATP-binding protein
VAIARALIIEPAVVLADEPTGALDSANAKQILELLVTCAAGGQTVVMVTHDPQMAERAGRVLLMHDGRFVENPGCPTAPANHEHSDRHP